MSSSQDEFGLARVNTCEAERLLERNETGVSNGPGQSARRSTTLRPGTRGVAMPFQTNVPDMPGGRSTRPDSPERPDRRRSTAIVPRGWGISPETRLRGPSAGAIVTVRKPADAG